MGDFKSFFIDLYDMVIKIVIVCFNVLVDLAWQFKLISLLIIIFLVLRMISSSYHKMKIKNSKIYHNGVYNSETDLDLYGEQQTIEILKKVPGHNKILSNIFLDGQQGIDLLMIHETGIYIFETKDYSGCIYGDEDKKKWIQIDKDGIKNKFLNPIWQNYENIKEIKKNIYDPERFAYKSYVVFNEKAELKNIEFDRTKNRVINRIRLFGSLSVDIEVSSKIFTIEQVDYIASNLEPYVRKIENDINKEA